MGCSPCEAAKERDRIKGYAYEDGAGGREVRPTEVEAYALKIRNDNKGTVRPVR